MEQRASALQQRLEARRNMFLKADQVAAPVKPAGATVVVAPPAPAQRSVKEALNVLNKSNGSDGDNSSTGSGGKPAVAAKPPPTTRIPAEVENKPTVKKVKQLDGYVGFANLPNQVYRKAVKKGFEFTLMVVGESGLGKSTLINSMFLTDVYSDKDYPGPSHRLKKTVGVETHKVLLRESGVNLRLSIVDTPGFGDAVDNSNCWDPIITFVEAQYESFLEAETKVSRDLSAPDGRVHACLYFIAPSGHGLKPLDVEFMKKLHSKVNVVPVIAKADTMTPEELGVFKKQIYNQILQAKIKIYEFPDEENNGSQKNRMPFAVVGSNCLIEAEDGKKIRGRRYPWGLVDIENMAHCDFIPLRNMLIRTHLQDLKEVTNNVHYENFRCRKLAGVAGINSEKIPNKNPLAQIEEERKEHENKMLKMEKEMEEVFERKVREKQQKLRDSENDLERRHKESMDKLEAQKRELEARLVAFEQEKATWQQQNGISSEDLKKLSLESLDGNKKKKSGGLSGVSFRMGR